MPRNNISEIVPGKLYQRASFWSWPRETKERQLNQYGIRLVVNLWTKVDPEVSTDSDRVYLHWPIGGKQPPPFEQLSIMVDYVVAMIKVGYPALIHCEAGVNRSVFLSVLVAAILLGIDNVTALKLVEEKCGRIKLNPQMKSYLKDQTNDL